MGYRPTEQYARIVGEADLEGLLAVVKIRPISRGYYNALLSKPDKEAYSQFLDDLVREWNLEDDQGPIPPTSDQIDRIDSTVLGAILGGWLKAMSVPPLASNVRHELGSTLTPEIPQAG